MGIKVPPSNATHDASALSLGWNPEFIHARACALLSRLLPNPLGVFVSVDRKCPMKEQHTSCSVTRNLNSAL